MLLEGLETLEVLAREGTMSRAASRLFITQSAVSKRIANLEHRLGKKLIEPDGRQVRLTADARALLLTVAPTLGELKGLLFDQLSTVDTTALQIAASETILTAYIGPFLQDYVRQDAHLSFASHHTPIIVERVRSGDAVVGIGAGQIKIPPGLSHRTLMQEPLILVHHQPPDYRQRLACLSIDLSIPSNRHLEPLLLEAGLDPVMQMNSFFAVAHIGRLGLMPAVIPLGVADIMQIPASQRFALPIAIERPINLLFRPSVYERPRVQRLIDCLQAHFARSQPSQLKEGNNNQNV